MPHATFWNHRTTAFGRKVTGSERAEGMWRSLQRVYAFYGGYVEKNSIILVATMFCLPRPRAVHALARTNFIKLQWAHTYTSCNHTPNIQNYILNRPQPPLIELAHVSYSYWMAKHISANQALVLQPNSKSSRQIYPSVILGQSARKLQFLCWLIQQK